MPSLTELSIKAAKPGAMLWDTNLKGFGLRCGAQRKTFVVLIASGRRQALGHWPLLGLAEARQLAKTILAEKQLGRIRPQRTPWADAVRDYLTDAEKRNRQRTVRDYRRLLSRHFDYGRASVTDITAKDILKKLNALKDTPSERHHAFTAARAFFRWCVQNHLIDRSPMENMATPKNGESRERVLSEDELQAVWKATECPRTPFHAIVRLLILTGQRRGEIGALRWEWVNEAEQIITFPATITKNKRTHTIPYGQLVSDVLGDIPRFSDQYVFPAARDRRAGLPATTFNGWGKPKATFDKECSIAPWTLHDLRRTFSSGMAALHVPQVVVEKLLNHVSGGTQSPIAAIYNRHQYLTEMRDAITKWETYLSAL